MSVKYVFVTGGVVSGLGKGITAASLATPENAWLQRDNAKFDPYIILIPVHESGTAWMSICYG